MNAKKAKALRRAVSQVVAFRAQVEGVTLPRNGLEAKATQKVIGVTLPPEWRRLNFLRLMTQAPKSPWALEARKALVPKYAQTAMTRPGSPEWLYKKAKRELP